MAKKGTQYKCPTKTVLIPADVRALQGQGQLIAAAIHTYWSKLRSDAGKGNSGKTV